MKGISTFFILFFSVTIILFSACRWQKLPGDLPKLNSVTIVLTQDSKTLDGADVVLVPVDSKWPALSSTNANGVATDFYTNGMYKGVAEGLYKVCVSKTVTEQTKIEIPPEPQNPSEHEIWRQKYVLGGFASQDKTYNLVDPKYETQEKTDLEINVKPGKNEFSFDVGKAVREEIKELR